ncbi:FG-GAP repeat protein [Symmachiella macrocystis]|uniref:FG-GAP repeat protein n=2 Tax=Symmachiella macrocystis TaxID=2527985 RepID=A0A5C6BQQ1_9PLAN|nr:FG-GAP repeat protein [Symmachiella macrocystis]
MTIAQKCGGCCKVFLAGMINGFSGCHRFSGCQRKLGMKRLILLLALGVIGCGPAEVTETNPAEDGDSHQRMLATLKEIQASSTDEQPYLNDGRQEQLAQQLESLPANVPPQVKLKTQLQLSEAQLQAGNSQQAVEQLLEAKKYLLEVASVVPRSDQVRDLLNMKLAVAYLRLAEDQNCVNCRDAECCIFPIQGKGVHRNKQPAQNAVKYLTAYLERNKTDATATWLLNVAYMTLGEYPEGVPKKWLLSDGQFELDSEFPKFKNISPQLGLNTFSLCGGMIVDDLNGDNWLDVVTSSWDTSGQMRCWLNNGDGTFTDHTEESGLTGLFGGLNMIQADYDNDGDVDILVLRGAWLRESGRHPNSLLQNDGHGRFRDVTFEVGLGDHFYPTQSAAWADYDNDGDLDLYIANEIGSSELFNNDGQGHFTNGTIMAGVPGGRYPKAVVWGDYNNDRYPDLYLSNLKGPNQLYHNNGDGTFTDVAAQAGVVEPNRSFPTWFWDFNNDGVLDIYVGAYWAKIGYFAADYLGHSHAAATDRLYQGDGNGGFHDVTEEMNLAKVTLPMGSNFGDIDNDGFLDFYLGTGYPDYAGIMPNRMFHNQNGLRFKEVTTAAGLGHLQKGHGVAFADYDHDGDQDIFIELGGAFRGDAFSDAVFQNPGFGNHWITVQLVGTKSNRAAIGARIRAEVKEDGKLRSIYKWVNSGGTFGGSPLRQHIGLGTANRIERLEVYWPTTDTTQVFTDLEVDQMIKIIEGEDKYHPISGVQNSNNVVEVGAAH